MLVLLFLKAKRDLENAVVLRSPEACSPVPIWIQSGRLHPTSCPLHVFQESIEMGVTEEEGWCKATRERVLERKEKQGEKAVEVQSGLEEGGWSERWINQKHYVKERWHKKGKRQRRGGAKTLAKPYQSSVSKWCSSLCHGQRKPPTSCLSSSRSLPRNNLLCWCSGPAA